MNSKIKSRIFFLAGIIMLLGAFAIWYKATYSMEKIATYSINSTNLKKQIAIATQGSAFKDAIVTNIVNHFEKDSVFIHVLDVSELPTLIINKYDKIVILHSWEYGSPPKVVSQFIEKNTHAKEKLIVMATSGQGSNKIQGIDAIAGESIIENAGDYADKIIEKLIY